MQISFEWIEPDNGGSAVTGYIVSYKKVDDQDYQVLVGGTSNFNDLHYTVSFGIIEGTEYQIIVKAANRWGMATLFSNPTKILAATTPSQVQNVVSTIDPVTGGLLVNWSQALNRGTPIMFYKLQLNGALGFSLISECTGLGLSCLITMPRIVQFGIPFMSAIPV